tara:strand:+ start:152 stop:466 length:315 start_codon:yes stop_codon:yes gene_type:complete
MSKAMDKLNGLSWYDKWMRGAAFDAYWRICASEVYEYEAVEIMRWIDEVECLTYAPEMEDDMMKALLDSQSVLVRTQYSDDCDAMIAYLDILLSARHNQDLGYV